MAVPADRFSTARTRAELELLPLRLPAALALAPVPPADEPEPEPASAVVPDRPPGPYRGGPVEFAPAGAAQREHGGPGQAVLARHRAPG
jgi:hypothetical protein